MFAKRLGENRVAWRHVKCHPLTLVVRLPSQNLPELLRGLAACVNTLLNDLDIVGTTTQVSLCLHKVGQLICLQRKKGRREMKWLISSYHLCCQHGGPAMGHYIRLIDYSLQNTHYHLRHCVWLQLLRRNVGHGWVLIFRSLVSYLVCHVDVIISGWALNHTNEPTFTGGLPADGSTCPRPPQQDPTTSCATSTSSVAFVYCSVLQLKWKWELSSWACSWIWHLWIIVITLSLINIKDNMVPSLILMHMFSCV